MKRFILGLTLIFGICFNGFSANVQHNGLTNSELHTAYPNGTDSASTYDAAPDVGDFYFETDERILSYCFVDDAWVTVSYLDQANNLENFIDGCWVQSNSATIDVEPGSIVINGLLRRITTVIQTNPAADPDTADFLDVWTLADASPKTFTVSLVDSGTVPGGSSNPGTNGRMIGSVYHKGAGVYSKVINFRPDFITGWGFIQGSGTVTMSETVQLGKTFAVNSEPPFVAQLGSHTSAPVDINDFTGGVGSATALYANTLTTTTFDINFRAEVGVTYGSGNYYGYSWIAYGRYS